MEPITWIKIVTAFANMLKAAIDARKSGLDYQNARSKTLDAASGGEFAKTEGNEIEMTISESMLDAYVADIKKAEGRFIKTINDPVYTPAQRQQEEEIARSSICKHLNQIRKFNAGSFPSEELSRLCESFGCDDNA